MIFVVVDRSIHESSGNMSFLEHSFDCWGTESNDIHFDTQLKGVEHIAMSNGDSINNNTSSFCEVNQKLNKILATPITHIHDDINCTAAFCNDALNISFDSCDSFELISLPYDMDNMPKIASPGTQNIVSSENIDLLMLICFLGAKSIIKTHTKRIVSHCVKNNQSYNSLENMARIINLTPNASVEVPATTHNIKKLVQPDISFEFHIECTKCKIYSATKISKSFTGCKQCSQTLKTQNSNHFVYFPMKQQLIKSVNEHFNQINSYQMCNEENDSTISDVHDSVSHKRVLNKYKNVNILSLTVNTDGASVHKSTTKSLWAIQCYQNYLPPNVRYIAKNILVIGLYYGIKKPDMQVFFLPLLQEMKHIQQSGGFCIRNNGKDIRFLPFILQCCCDLPAKAEVQGMLNHNGYQSCGYCLHAGVSIKSKKNSVSVVRYVQQQKPPELRTHQSMLLAYRTLKSNPICGVKKISCMLAANEFDLVDGYCIDYMHCVLLGVVPKLLSLWFDSVNHKESYYVKPKDQVLLNKRIIEITPPSEISRKPRPISDRSNFKANEYRNFLLYYLPYCLTGLLANQFLKHFNLLSSSIFILLKKQIKHQEIDEVEKTLNQFANEFEAFYGSQNVTMNVHLLRHIANSVRLNGPLWAQSAFGFESNNGVLVKTSSKKDILHSMAWKYSIESTLNATESINQNLSAIKVTGREFISPTQNEQAALSKIGFKSEKNSLEIYKCIEVNGKKFTSLKSKKIATSDYFVQTKQNGIAAIKFFFPIQQVIHVMIEEFNVISTSSHFTEIVSNEICIAIPFKDIDNKLLYMNVLKKNIVAPLPNNYEKT